MDVYLAAPYHVTSVRLLATARGHGYLTWKLSGLGDVRPDLHLSRYGYADVPAQLVVILPR